MTNLYAARDLADKINYIGQERAARNLLVKMNTVPVEKVATMTELDVYEAILDKYKFIILNNLIKFWSGFKNLNDNVFARIGDIDICTVPQILYSLSQALKSEKDTNSNNDLYK